MKQKKRFSSIALLVWFLFIMIFLSAWNMDRFVKIVWDDFSGNDPLISPAADKLDTARQRPLRFNMYYTRYFRFMEPLKEVTGFSYMALNKRAIDNFSYIKDFSGNMQLVEDDFNKAQAEEQILILADAFGERDIPFLFVSMPPRFDIEDFPIARELDFYGQHEAGMLGSLSDAGVWTLDTKQELKDAGLPYLYPFKTDIHLQTKGEIEAARLIAEELSAYGVEINDADIIFDRNNYTVETYDFGGNLIRSAGLIFTGGLDDFELWFPDFETDLTVEDPVKNKVTKRGPFSESVMNQMDPNTTTAGFTLYWVVNYLQYSTPYSTIDNNLNKDGPRLLFIIDSYSFRTVSHMSLGAGHITIIDPRQRGSKKHLIEAMENGEYDAVIVAAGGKEFYEKISF